ncbi:hypothetical protein BAR153v2_002160 [Bartonella sp. AR 15-3]|nr:hypothetical protein BAR153v2_002160 [Bartonella sp. AR 15-3]
MVSFILFSLMCAIALYSCCVLKCHFKWVYRYIFHSKVALYASVKGALVKGLCTDEYSVQ